MTRAALIAAPLLILASATFYADLFSAENAAPKITGADTDRAIAGRTLQEPGRLFDRYMATHDDTPDPELKFPTVAIRDEPMWNWTEHALLRHEHQSKYWTLTDDGSWPDHLLPSATVTYYAYSSGATSTFICGIPAGTFTAMRIDSTK